MDGIVVSPEPVESPKRVLQRWVEAGKPSMAVYARLVPDAEFRALKRAVGVVATGEVTVDRPARGNPARKKTRAEEHPAGTWEQSAALQLLVEINQVDLAATTSGGGGARQLFAAPPSQSNNAVRCFQFAQVCAMQWNHVQVATS